MTEDGKFAAEWFETPLGAMLAIADDRHLLALTFQEVAQGANAADVTVRHNGRPVRSGGNHITHQVGRELADYFSGKGGDFTTPLAPQGNDFERAVWAELLKVPLGETCSYGDIARTVANLEASRAVGKANGANPIPIIIPCHRCIGADGSLTGYGGGLWRKKWLLRHEAEMRPTGLFAYSAR